MMPDHFHFLRPIWLLAAGLIPVLFLWARQQGRSAGAWSRVCDAALLPHLLVGERSRVRRWPVWALATAWGAACLALAGPTWEQLPQAAYSEPTDTVAVLSLSPSMRERDVAPSRLERARFELQDLLTEAEGTVGLVIFSEEAYAVTPLTDDARVITETIPVLEPRLMPGRGARLDRGIEEASRLLDNAQTGEGRIVLVVDQAGEKPSAAIEAAERAADAGYTVSVVALTDQDRALREVAEAGGGVWTLLRPDDSDIREVLMAGTGLPGDLGSLRRSQAEADVWRDMGAWLVLIPLALAPLAFRRGWVGSLMLFALLGTGGAPAQAGVVDWFRTADQQGAAAFEAGEHDEAAQRFEDPEWQAAARYREANYEAAVEALSELDSARAQYNLGNALARSGKLEQAIAAYDQALEQEPSNEDAQFNRDLVQDLLEDQQNQSPPPQPDSESSESESDQNSQDESSAGQEESQGQETASNEDSASSSSDGSSGESSSNESEKSSSESAQAGDPSPEEAGASGENSEQAQPQPGTESAAAEPSENQTEEGLPQNKNQRPTDGTEIDRPTPASEMEGGESDSPETEETGTRRAVADALQPADDAANPSESAVAAAPPVQPMSERDQELEQRLSQVPDDPGGLLAEKLRRQYAQKQGLIPRNRGGRR
ncbi:MAG: VWA domain-containing protein [Myxococcota bacterium]|nr:VWA domain-containing protein [Myxococcota bacterium]